MGAWEGEAARMRIHSMTFGGLPLLCLALGCNAMLGLDLAEASGDGDGEYDAAAPDLPHDTWVEVEPMKSSRIWHSATLLGDDQVLVVAGKTDDFASVSLPELFRVGQANPPSVAMATPRFAHTTTLLPYDGTVLIAGGEPFKDSGAELFDPGTNLWEKIGALSAARIGHTATLLDNGDVLVSGGSQSVLNGPVRTSEVYHPDSKHWTTMDSSMTTGHTWHTATRLPSGEVLVAGGWGNDNLDTTRIAELYDRNTDTWIETASMNAPRQWHTATLLGSGLVLVVGGWDGFTALSSAELYDPERHVWVEIDEPMRSHRCGHTATLLGNGSVLVTGGSDGAALDSAELFDPARGTWTNAAPMRVPRYLHTATLLPDGRTLVLGGDNGPSLPITALWSAITPLPRAELYIP